MVGRCGNARRGALREALRRFPAVGSGGDIAGGACEGAPPVLRCGGCDVKLAQRAQQCLHRVSASLIIFNANLKAYTKANRITC